MEFMPEIKQGSVSVSTISESANHDTVQMNGDDFNETKFNETMVQQEEKRQKDSSAAADDENAQAAMPEENVPNADSASTDEEAADFDANIPAVTPPSTEDGVAHPVATLHETVASDVELPASNQGIQNDGDSQPTDTFNDISVDNKQSEKQSDTNARDLGESTFDDTQQAGQSQTLNSDENENSPGDQPLVNGVESSADRAMADGVEPNGGGTTEPVSDAQIESIVADMIEETNEGPISFNNDEGSRSPEMASRGQSVSMDVEHEFQGETPPATAYAVQPMINSSEGSQMSEGSAMSSCSTSSASAEVIDLLDISDDEDSNVNATQQNGPPATKRQRTEGAPVSAGAVAYSAVGRMLNPAVQQQHYAPPAHQQQEQHAPPSHQQQHDALALYRNPIYIPPIPGFVATWKNILPTRTEPRPPNQNNRAKSYQLSLLNVSEFTITGLRVGDEYTGHMTSLAGLRGTIKRIARDHGNAFFERDPDGEGKWHIPLGAYHALYGFLKNDPTVIRVDGISEDQLKIASLGKARLEKEFPSPRKLVKFGVPKKLAETLAPFQRGGVDFVIEKEGRALIADEMGLGKSTHLRF